MDEATLQRFWSKVDKSAGPTGCWLWTGPLDSTGSGYFWVAHRKRLKPHRVAYELVTGETLGSLKCDHMCHNRACCNPSHLRPATQKQNMENRLGAQRNSSTGVRGVTKVEEWHRAAPEHKGKYLASLQHYGKKVYVGYFETVEQADAAVRAKRVELFTHNDADRIDVPVPNWEE